MINFQEKKYLHLKFSPQIFENYKPKPKITKKNICMFYTSKNSEEFTLKNDLEKNI